MYNNRISRRHYNLYIRKVNFVWVLLVLILMFCINFPKQEKSKDFFTQWVDPAFHSKCG